MKIILIFIFIILMSSCATMQVKQYSGVGISSEVKKEQIKAQKRINKQQRITDKVHRKRTKYINNLQNKNYDW